MKKTLLILSSILTCGIINAQTLLFDNGPLVNHPGAGFGGADVSSLHDGITLYGFNHSVVGSSKVAEDFTVPLAGWTIDSMVFFSYQTNSTLTTTFTEVRMGVWDGSPALSSNIIYGDTAVNALTNSYWSGIYRTTETMLTNSARPIMRNVVATPGLILAAGTYFVSWQSAGTLASGPWAPPITFGAGLVTTGDGLQYTTAAGVGAWNLAKDTAVNLGVGSGTGALQGFPFQVYGHLTTVGVPEMNKEFGVTNIYPVPAFNSINVNYNSKVNVTALISLKDNLGRELFFKEQSFEKGDNNILMDLSRFQSGLYFITARTEQSFNVVKFIKE